MKQQLLTFLFCLFSSTLSHADHGPLGAGLMIGDITSVTGKYWSSQEGAIDFGVGSFRTGSTILYVDYLYHFTELFGTGTQFGRQTKAYLGGGVGLGFWNRRSACDYWRCDSLTDNRGTAVFARGLFGFEWFPSKPPLGVFAELGPLFVITPSTGGLLHLALGVRYYF